MRTVADHAYWLSGIALRDGGGTAPLGTVDARSAGFGVGDPKPGATQNGGGSLTGGNLGALAYTSQSQGVGRRRRRRRAPTCSNLTATQRPDASPSTRRAPAELRRDAAGEDRRTGHGRRSPAAGAR